jgi:hypothetical protein
MTWCSEYSAVPRCLLARSAIRCRPVDKFAGFSVPSRVSLQRFSPRGASLPSVGSQRARFPDFAGTMKALRPPPQACPGPLWVRFQAPQAPLCSCSPKRSRRGRVRVRAWALISRVALSGTLLEDLQGISQVSWRSIPDLCPALRPRPDQRDLAMAVLPVLPPGPTHRRLQRGHDIGAQPRASVSAAYASRASLPPPMQGSLPAGGLRLCREGVEPSGTRWKVSDYIILLPRTSPVASWIHAKPNGA